jgi:hypothetical protein
MRIVMLTETEKIANELAGLLAKEHQRATDEQAKREAAEATATELAVLLALDRAALEREREARERAEAQASELSALVLGEEDRTPPRFVPAARGAARRFRPLQRVS